MISKIFNLPGWLLAFISILVLITLGFLSLGLFEESYYSSKNMISDWEDHYKENICTGYLKIISVKDNIAYGISSSGTEYKLRIEKNQVVEHETYSFKGTIDLGGIIGVENIQHHPHRKLKYILSCFSFLVVFYLIVKFIRFEKKSFGFKALY